jgi:alpha/beta superfamily hydrolase
MKENTMKLFHLALVAFSLLVFIENTLAEGSENLEESLCGSIKEPFVFWMWKGAAGKPDPEAAIRIQNAEPIVHKTKDGRLLRGYKLKSTAAGGSAIGSVLVAQGNAMLADQLLSSLRGFSQSGLDVYVFDYRGYGNSEGKSRLKAIVNDYKEIFDQISSSVNGKRFLYGISFGGVVLLNVVGSGIQFDRVVIDSAPSRISNLGCPEKYDPVENFPKDGSRFLLIAGKRDKVVPLKNSQELIEFARVRGSRIEVYADFAHPFMDSDITIHRERLELIKSFFLLAERTESR